MCIFDGAGGWFEVDRLVGRRAMGVEVCGLVVEKKMVFEF